MNNQKQLSIDKLHIPRWNELPSVDLYLDQVVTLINSTFSNFISSNTTLEKDSSMILTKTMINNYVKNRLIEPPTGKKYSKVQLAKLFAICILKQVYSMNSIKTLIGLALEKSDVRDCLRQFFRSI